MNFFVSLFVLLIVISPAIASSEDVLVSKDWTTVCREDVFDGTNECFLFGHSKSPSGKTLVLERNNNDEFVLVIINEEDAEREWSAQIDVTIKIDDNEAISTNGVASFRVKGYTQLVAKFSVMPKIIEQMKRGNHLHSRFFSSRSNKKVLDKFSLSGFSESLKKALSLDKRRPRSKIPEPVNNRNQSSLGATLEEWEAKHKLTDTSTHGKKYYDAGYTPEFWNNGKVSSIDADFEESLSFNKVGLMSKVHDLIPSDSVVLKKFQPFPSAHIIKYKSKSLSKKFSGKVFEGGESGVFYLSYSDSSDGKFTGFLLSVGSY